MSETQKRVGAGKHMLGKHLSVQTKEKIKLRVIVAMQRPEVRRAIADGMRVAWKEGRMTYSCISPNRSELRLLELVQPFGFSFVGDGQLVIDGKCPDFWDGDHKVIELYGDYWHQGDDPQERIDLFARQGYTCFVIWESELRDDLCEIRTQLLNFVGKEC